MSLRPRSAHASWKSSGNEAYTSFLRQLNSVDLSAGDTAVSATTPRRTAAMMRPVVRAAEIGAFVNVPDTKEHEDLVSRVSALEALFGGFQTGYKSFESTFRATTAQLNELNLRCSDTEQKAERLSSQVKSMLEQTQTADRNDRRLEGLVVSNQNEIARLRRDLNRLMRNMQSQGNGDDRDYKPKGFRANDQPAQFMGRGM